MSLTVWRFDVMRISLPILSMSLCMGFALMFASNPAATAKAAPAKVGSSKHIPVTPTKAATAVSALGPIQDKWAIVIGINTFADKRIPTLRYAAKDAEDFARFLVDKQNFARDHVLLMTNENATEDQILDAIGDNWLPRRAFPDDLVLVYVSSHGSPKEVDVAGENFLVAHDTKVDRLFSSGIRLEDLAPTIKKRTGCQRIVLLLDACNSGAADVTAKGLVRNMNFDINSFAGEGLIVISSSQADQRSWESSRYANGVFTKRLMEALESSGPTTTISKAFEVLEEAVQEEVKFDRKAFQKPLMKSKWTGADLSLAAIPARPRRLSKELSEGEVTSPPEVADSTSEPDSSSKPPSALIGSIPLPPMLGNDTNTNTPPAASSGSAQSHPWLGLKLETVTAQLAQTMNLPATTQGTIIREIAPGSGASNSGLHVGDIVLSINGFAVPTAADVQKMARAHHVGDALNVGVLRNGAGNSYGVILGEYPGDAAASTIATASGATPANPDPVVPPTYSVPGAAANDPLLAATVQKNVHALPDKIAIIPFTQPKNFELTKTADYPRDFTPEDRTKFAELPWRMWQQVVSDVAQQLPDADVMPAQTLRDTMLRAQGMKFDLSDATRASNQLGSFLGARYVVITTISKFSFAARVNWSNEYNIKLVTTILDAQRGQILATIPKTVTRTPWLGDSRMWFTEYLEKIILPEFCKKMAQEIARKTPHK